MEQGKEHAGLEDLRVEVTVTELRPRFNGGYSDVHVGRLHDEKVGQNHAQLKEHDADVTVQVAVKIIKPIGRKSLETMQRVSN
jgi:hypothetical protein